MDKVTGALALELRMTGVKPSVDFFRRIIFLQALADILQFIEVPRDDGHR